MPIVLRAWIVMLGMVSMGLVASSTKAQDVSMFGSYAVSTGQIINTPRNPPLAACDPAEAQCVGRRDLTPNELIYNSSFAGSGISLDTHGSTHPGVPPAFSGTPDAVPLDRYGPSRGVRGARVLQSSLGSETAVGGAFTIPPLAFQQQRGRQIGQVLSNAVKQIETTYTLAMPATHRTKHAGVVSGMWTTTPEGGRGLRTSTNASYVPPASTRMFAPRVFSPSNLAAHGQNNGRATTDPAYRYRQAIDTSQTVMFAADSLTLRYSNSNPTAFSGTAAILLDGAGGLYYHSPDLSDAFSPPTTPNALAPIVGRNPLGDDVPGFEIRDAAGWDYTVMDVQLPGVFKAFGPAVASISTSMGGFHVPNAGIRGVPCTPDVGPLAPNATCNLLGGDFHASGYTVTPAAAATFTRHVFAWTTGTVSIFQSGPRNGIQVTATFTGMGYDSVTSMGDRNVGLVAGSYALRRSVTGNNTTAHIAGLDLVFTPEPGGTISLVAGLGGLWVLRRRRVRRVAGA